MNFSAVLLAGGRSTRMGRDKAWLDWHGVPLWRHQLEKLTALQAERVFISCRRDQGFEDAGCALIYDASDATSPCTALPAVTVNARP